MPPVLLHCVCLDMSYSKHPYTVACVAGVRRGKGEFGRARRKGQERSFPFSLLCPNSPFPLLTPATQATIYSYSKKGCPKKINVHTTFPIWDMINTHYTVPDVLYIFSCRTYFCCFSLALTNIRPWPLMPSFQILENSELKTTHNAFQDCCALFLTTLLEIAAFKPVILGFRLIKFLFTGYLLGNQPENVLKICIWNNDTLYITRWFKQMQCVITCRDWLLRTCTVWLCTRLNWLLHMALNTSLNCIVW